MNADVHAKAVRFRTLHQGPGAFVIANAWDAGSGRLREAAKEVRERGTFTYLDRAVTSAELGRFMRQD